MKSKYFFVQYVLINDKNVNDERSGVIGMPSKHFDPTRFYDDLLLLPRETEHKFIIRNFQRISKEEFMFLKKFRKK